MSCYYIKVEKGRKVARPITSEQEYRELRNSSQQMANLRLARNGNDAAKRRLVQMNYSGHYPGGTVKGNKLPSKAFGFDLDDPESFKIAAEKLLQDPGKYGLLMLERSARQGGHVVCKREQGKPSWRIRCAWLRCCNARWTLRLTTSTECISLQQPLLTTCSISRPNSSLTLMMKLPSRQRQSCWKNEKIWTGSVARRST